MEPPLWPGTMVTICESYFITGGPGKEHRTNKPPPTRRVWERSKGDTTSQNPSCWNPSWLSNVCTTRKDPESEWLPRGKLEINPITQKKQDCEPHGRAVLLGSLTFLLSAQAPFPNKVSCFVSMYISLDNSLPSVRQEPTFRPWRGSPHFRQHYQINITA